MFIVPRARISLMQNSYLLQWWTLIAANERNKFLFSFSGEIDKAMCVAFGDVWELSLLKFPRKIFMLNLY